MPMIRLSRGCSIWSTSAVSASTSVMPAPIRVASCRVAMARSWPETRDPNTCRRSTSRERPCPLRSILPVAGRDDEDDTAAAAAPSAARTSVRKMPSLRKRERRTLRFSASLTPRTFFPASVRPLYSKTGMGRLGRVVLRDGEHLGDARHPAQHLGGAVVEQGTHPLLRGGLPDGAAVHVLQDELPDVVVEHHDLVDARAAPVPAAVAAVAA